MDTQLSELEAKLQKLYEDHDFNDRRAIFDIGVQFGSLIQEQHIQGYEYVFWKKLEEDSNKEKLIKEAVKAVEKLLLKLVQYSIKDHINKNGSWSIAKGIRSSEYDEFDAGTLRKYCVQITRVDMTQYGGDFECTFKVVGRLAQLFKKHNVNFQLDVIINNEDGEEYTNIYRGERVSSTVSRLYCHVKNGNNWELDQYRDFFHIISKEFLFDLINEP